jgi:hypothetical protein
MHADKNHGMAAVSRKADDMHADKNHGMAAVSRKADDVQGAGLAPLTSVITCQEFVEIDFEDILAWRVNQVIRFCVPDFLEINYLEATFRACPAACSVDRSALYFLQTQRWS